MFPLKEKKENIQNGCKYKRQQKVKEEKRQRLMPIYLAGLS